MKTKNNKKVTGITLHRNVLAVAEDKPLYISNVEDWLEYNDSMRKQYSTLARKKQQGALARSLIHEGYVKEIRHYFRTGDWISDFYGRDQEFPTPRRVYVRRG
jgi:hypothetical protein|tara:strand:- start:648 stop:956 length:309 start_codon:yes stop_codon:yes gene_type:complete